MCYIFMLKIFNKRTESISHQCILSWNTFKLNHWWFRRWYCGLFSRLSSAAAVSSPLHPSSAAGVGGHVAGGPEGERAGLRDGGGVHQHHFRNRTWSSECGSESSAPPGTQSSGEAVFDIFMQRLVKTFKGNTGCNTCSLISLFELSKQRTKTFCSAFIW